MTKVTTKIDYPVRSSSELRTVAELVSKFYGLDVVIEGAVPSSSEAILKVVTPSGEVVVELKLSIYKGESHRSLGGQSFVTSEHMGRLRKVMEEEIK